MSKDNNTRSKHTQSATWDRGGCEGIRSKTATLNLLFYEKIFTYNHHCCSNVKVSTELLRWGICNYFVGKRSVLRNL